MLFALFLRIVLGTLTNSSLNEEILLEDDLCDNQWHQLNVKVMEDTTYAKVDVGNPFAASNAKRILSLDKAVTVGGATERATDQSASKRNFDGCVSYVILNGLDVLQRINKRKTNTRWGCEDDLNFDVINFDSREAYLKFLNPTVPRLDIGLQFRTYYQGAILMTNEVNSSTTVQSDSKNLMRFTLYLKENVVNLRVQGFVVISIRPSEDIDFGSWNAVRLRMDRDTAELTVGQQTRAIRIDEQRLKQGYYGDIYIGKGNHIAQNFRGWIWNVMLNGKRETYLNATGIKAVGIGIYKMKDFCYPNHCNNGGRCIQTIQGSHCNCSNTGYDGATCSNRIKKYKRSCYDYYLRGERKNGVYVIEPEKKPFQVYCKMDEPNGPKTIFKSKQGDQLKAVYEATGSDREFYYHSFDYGISKEEIDDVVRKSGKCRQYIQFFCSSSTLMFSNDKENALANRYGARWFSSSGEIRNYWGGGNKEPFTCECGRAGNCVNPALKCNCDVMDAKWRSDGGYLTDKHDLPVSKIQFSRKYTNPSAMYKLGPLECFGDSAKTTRTTLSSTTAGLPRSPTYIRQQQSVSPDRRTISPTIDKASESKKQTLLHGSVQLTSATTTRSMKEKTRTFIPVNDASSFLPHRVGPYGSNISSTAVTQGRISSLENAATRQGTKLKSTSRSLLGSGYVSPSVSTISGKQMIILVTLISCLALLTLLLIVALLRQRLLKSSKKLTIELKQDADNGSQYSESASSNDRPFTDDDRLYRSMNDVNRIEIIAVASPYRKPTASESESSVSSFDASRYLEVGDESDTGSSSSFTKRKGILKSNTKYVMSSRPKSEGDADGQGEVIGLLHVNSKNCTAKSSESASLLSDSRSAGLEDVQFHLHPRHENYRERKTGDYIEQFSYSDRDSADVETGFIIDSSSSSSSSCDSRKSLSSSGSEGSEESSYECNSKNTRRPKRSVRFSVQEFSPKKMAQPVSDFCVSTQHNEADDDVFT